MANSIGSLYIDIHARTAALESDMDKVKNSISKATTATSQAGESAKSAFKSFQLFNSFEGRGMTGITLDMMAFSMALAAVKSEIFHVIKNIEKIPGMPTELVANVQQFRVYLSEARLEIDKIIAHGVSGFLYLGKAIGHGIGALLYGRKAAMEAMEENQRFSPDRIASSADPLFFEKVKKEVEKLTKARAADVAAQLEGADKIIELRKQSAELDTQAESADIDSLKRAQLQLQSTHLQIEADNLHTGIKKRYGEFTRRVSSEEIRDGFVELSQKSKMLELERKIGEAIAATGLLRPTTVGQTLGDLTAEQMDAANKKFPQLLSWMAQYRAELQKLRSASMEWRDMTVNLSGELNNFLTSFVTGGKIKINDFLKSVTDAIIQTFFKLALINPLLNALFGSTKGFSILPTLFGGKADGGPARGLTLVGERGPELLNLGSGSTIIPNHAMVSGGGSGMTVYMDARGADESRIQQMERNLAFLHATFERRVLGVTVNFKNRRGAAASALS